MRCKKRRRKRYAAYDRHETLDNQMSIDERPAIVEERARAGDWKPDNIIVTNHRLAIMTMTERAQRLNYLCKVEAKDATSVEDTLVKTLK